MKIGPDGEMEWSAVYGGRGNEYGHDALPLADGFLLVGYTTSFGAGSRDIYVVRTDARGSARWARHYGDKGRDDAVAVCAVGGGFVLAGTTSSRGAGEEDVYVLKIDGDGNELWTGVFGGERSEMASSVGVTAGGDILVAASTGTYGKGNDDFYLLRLDADGRKIWEKSYGNKGQRGYGYDWCGGMALTGDGGALLAGHTDCQDVQNVYILNVDAAGTEQWSRVMGRRPFIDYGNAVSVGPDGRCWVAGVSKSVDGNNDLWLACLDAAGKVVFERIIAAAGAEWVTAVEVTAAGEVLVLGQTDSYGAGGFDVCLWKFKSPSSGEEGAGKPPDGEGGNRRTKPGEEGFRMHRPGRSTTLYRYGR
jgi:hypothetical protein